MNKSNSRIINISIFVFVLILGFIIAEYAFRAMLFSEYKAFDNLKNPGDYCNSDIHEDYWKLFYKFNEEYRPPENPHPLLGWKGGFHPESYIHHAFRYLGNKKPVLLFGDSFARCVDQSKCFQEILNNDDEFTNDNYLLNYGVGGYGVGQISLLSQKVIPLFKNPFVVFSLLTYDLDRSVLSVRTGQKPYYKIENDSLKLCGIPINSNPKEFFDSNPPEITSYLFNKFLFSNLNFLPKNITSYLIGEKEDIKNKIEVNESILLDVVNRLKKK